MSFQDFKLHSKLLRAVEASGFVAPTEIQRRVIPVALEGRDVMASAQTGTGKTAAFVLPCLQRLLTPAPARENGPRVLVLTPTRELAVQVFEHVRQLSRFTTLRGGAVVGGMPYPGQERLLKMPLDLLVATPGRLIDHMERGSVAFSRLEVLVIDEADRMLDMGFVDDVDRIARAAPAKRQTILTSATLEGEVEEIAQRHLIDPVRIQLTEVTGRHEAIDQLVYEADDARHKRALLDHLLAGPGFAQGIVFTATKRGAEDLATGLAAAGFACAALHGDMDQDARRRTVDRLRAGQHRVLVATDVAARGLDFQGISHVINFDLPSAPEDYIHRIGRTGRAGATGIAVSLVAPDDWSKLVRIERVTAQRLDRRIGPGLEPRMARGESAPRGRPPAAAGAKRSRSAAAGGGDRPKRGGGPQRGGGFGRRRNQQVEAASAAFGRAFGGD
ncbi:MAG TPA: DEAD/DEAH box helicase [Geminicoccaceae bacterium]|nr:DEAD/DEAH box helicase [Geminicoccaceae bacterium]